MAANHAFRSIISECIRNRAVVSAFVNPAYSMRVFRSHGVDQIIASVRPLCFCSMAFHLFLHLRLPHLVSSWSPLGGLLGLGGCWFHPLLWRHCWVCEVPMGCLQQCDSSICLSISWILSLAQAATRSRYVLGLQLGCVLHALRKWFHTASAAFAILRSTWCSLTLSAYRCFVPLMCRSMGAIWRTSFEILSGPAAFLFDSLLIVFSTSSAEMWPLSVNSGTVGSSRMPFRRSVTTGVGKNFSARIWVLSLSIIVGFLPSLWCSVGIWGSACSLSAVCLLHLDSL